MGHVRGYRGSEAPLDVDDQAFLDNQLSPSFGRSVSEQAIRKDEEVKGAESLAVLEQAVEDKEQAIEDAIRRAPCVPVSNEFPRPA